MKQLDCFGTCNYQIGDRAYYHLKPADRVINLRSSMRYDKPAVLHTFLHQKGLLGEAGCDQPDKTETEKRSSAAASTLPSCVDTLASGTVNDTSQVTFLLRIYFLQVFSVTHQTGSKPNEFVQVPAAIDP